MLDSIVLGGIVIGCGLGLCALAVGFFELLDWSMGEDDTDDDDHHQGGPVLAA
jgi:hypothetical protein